MTKRHDGWTPITLSMPTSLVADLEKYAGLVRGGKKSAFVQDAVLAYIEAIEQAYHPEKLKASVRDELAAEAKERRRGRKQST